MSFSLERVGAVDEVRARSDRFDRAAARDARDLDAVAAGDRRAAALEHAVDALAVVERDRVVAAIRGDDRATVARSDGARVAWRRRVSASRRSTRAAQMRSFRVMPPASCVDQRDHAAVVVRPTGPGGGRRDARSTRARSRTRSSRGSSRTGMSSRAGRRRAPSRATRESAASSAASASLRRSGRQRIAASASGSRAVVSASWLELVVLQVEISGDVLFFLGKVAGRELGVAAC